MAPRILITGKGGKSGSWQIRAVQLGDALGAEVQAMAETSDCRSADLIVVVKRTPKFVMDRIRASGRRWVYDVVDGWPQPCRWGEREACGWLRGTLQALRPDGVVFGTERMRRDSGYTAPSIVLPHHAWPKYSANPVRHSVGVVGYEGDPRYLGRWHDLLDSECHRRGWRFAVNEDMRQADIGVALRDSGGYPARWWKPGTKLANLQALGIPAICGTEQGMREIANGSEFWTDSPADLVAAMDALADPDLRSAIAVVQRESVVTLEKVAKDYAAWLKTIP